MAAANTNSVLFGDTTHTTYTVTHGITATHPLIQIFDAATETLVVAEITIANATQALVTLGAIPGTNALRLTVVG